MYIKNKFIYKPIIPLLLAIIVIIIGITIGGKFGFIITTISAFYLPVHISIALNSSCLRSTFIKALLWRKITLRDSPDMCIIDNSVDDEKNIGFVYNSSKILYAINNKNIFDTLRDFEKNHCLGKFDSDEIYDIDWKIVNFQINKKNKVLILIVEKYIFDAIKDKKIKIKTMTENIFFTTYIDEKFLCSDMVENKHIKEVFRFIIEIKDDKVLAKFKLNNLNIL